MLNLFLVIQVEQYYQFMMNLKNHSSIKHILVRHEQGAGHAAEGYARSSGKPGVVLSNIRTRCN